MMDYAFWLTSFLLVVSKIPDVVTTYRGIRRTGNPRLEQNPIARLWFLKFGLNFGMVQLCFIYLAVVALSAGGYFALDESSSRFWWGMVFVLHGLFTSIVQLQVARYNVTGVMAEPLRSVHRMLSWFYARS